MRSTRLDVLLLLSITTVHQLYTLFSANDRALSLFLFPYEFMRLLFQYYVYLGDQKYVDLGLGSHRVKCRVNDKFRLIVIAERDVVYSKFPIPLINRLEKHYLVTLTSLTPAQSRVVHKLREWVTEFSTVQIPQHEQRRLVGVFFSPFVFIHVRLEALGFGS